MGSSASLRLPLVAVVLFLCILASTTVAATQLKLTLFDPLAFPNAVCNDGTPSGFYYLPATSQPNRWIFHLEGGWWCWDDKSCTGRLGSKSMVSSASWPTTRSFGGIFSNNPSVSPDWVGVNFVFMPYCTSDAWAGDGTGLVNGTMWQFRGRSVVEAVFKSFFEGAKFTSPQEVLFSGCSAGGQGLLYNVDHVSQLLSQLVPSGVTVKGFADSGWMMNLPSIRNPTTEIHTQFKAGWKLWQPRESDCSIVNPVDPYHCFFSPNIISYITTPTLIQSSAYDAFQVPYDCCSPPFTDPSAQWMSQAIARATRNAMHDLIHPPHSVYSPSCFTHCLSEGTSFSKVQIDGTSLATKLSNWYFTRLPDLGPMIDDCGFNCSTHC
jgi:hypothetical protein